MVVTFSAPPADRSRVVRLRVTNGLLRNTVWDGEPATEGNTTDNVQSGTSASNPNTLIAYRPPPSTKIKQEVGAVLPPLRIKPKSPNAHKNRGHWSLAEADKV